MTSKKNSQIQGQSSILSFFKFEGPVKTSNPPKTSQKKTHNEIFTDEKSKKENSLKEKLMAPPKKPTIPLLSENKKDKEENMNDIEDTINKIMLNSKNEKNVENNKEKKKKILIKNNKKIIKDSEDDESYQPPSNSENFIEDDEIQDGDYDFEESSRSNKVLKKNKNKNKLQKPKKKNTNIKHFHEEMSEDSEESFTNKKEKEINLNSFLKNTLEADLSRDPSSLNANIYKTFKGCLSSSTVPRNSSDDSPSPSSFPIITKKLKTSGKSRSRSRSHTPHKSKKKRQKTEEDMEDDFSDEVSNISNEEGLAIKNSFANPHDALPDFLKPENIKDKNGLSPDSPDYDPNTLFVPPSYIKEQTAMMKQYWQFKSQNFDKVIFYKLGKFYEMFFDDAIIGNQVLGLNWMGNDPRKLHVGFPEKALEGRAAKLVENGFKVAVVEQMETVEEYNKRIKTDKNGEKTIKREICDVFTKGTYYKGEDELINNSNNNSNQNSNNKNNNFSSTNKKQKKEEDQDAFFFSSSNKNIKNNINKNKFCVSIFCYQQLNTTSNADNEIFLGDPIENINFNNTQLKWGICLFDVTTLKFYLGQIIEDLQSFSTKSNQSQTQTQTQSSYLSNINFNKLKTFLYNINPEEIICFRNNLPSKVNSFISSLSSKPLITSLKNTYNFNQLNTLCQKYFGEDFTTWNSILVNSFTHEKENFPLLNCLYLTIIYLEKILLAENSLPIASFYEYNGNENLNPNKKMIIDYQAVTNLELTQTKIDPRNPEAGSLVEYLNKAVSPFGKRLLKNWILNPLCDINKINERLDIVDDLINNEELIVSFRNSLSKWIDIERICSKFYKLAMGNENKKNAIYFEDIGKSRIKEFFKLLNFLASCQSIFDLFNKYIKENKFKSEILIKKVTIGDNGDIPNLSFYIKNLLNNFHIVETKDNKGNTITNIESLPGVYPEYDDLKKEISEIKETFDEILLRERKRLKCVVINYAHTKTYRYELEVPENVVKNNRPKEYKLTTAKKGYQRFHTQEIIDNVEKLEFIEEKIRDIKSKLNQEMFKRFYQLHDIISTFINKISEIDCLMALSFISSINKDRYSRPKFVTSTFSPFIDIEESIHPCLYERTPYFVPNNISIGKDNKNLIVITGPNMGGKSTLLRQVCITAIIAQIGCYVPAKSCRMSIVDRIFTRIGAADKILEGKSTFFVEMEETKNILENATCNSLIIMDELGRGTSTKDGKIIAKTVLYYLEKKIKARCLFTTHYHDIIEWCRREENMELYFMDSIVNGETKDITFLYKFKKGICPESYGIEVAKLAGIPQKVIDSAQEIKEKNLLDIQ